jgi:diguanylate cyclase
VTISLGVTEFIAGQRLKDVVKQADDALYLAKEKGRNQVQTG